MKKITKKPLSLSAERLRPLQLELRGAHGGMATDSTHTVATCPDNTLKDGDCVIVSGLRC
jgi:hypothetical protein